VDYNPYADFTTHKINQILAEGGFAPEWVMLRLDQVFTYISFSGLVNKTNVVYLSYYGTVLKIFNAVH
jgi:hypothetical protein